jgi:hypothetical protein
MSTFEESLDQVLRLLDAAPAEPGELFPSQASKERYESMLLFSLRRFQAAAYHFDRVGSVLLDYRDYILTLELPERPRTHEQLVQTSARITGTLDTSKLEYEFSAFLAAIKSSLDFLATAAMWHLRGMDGDSISNLLKLVRKGCSGPIVDEVAAEMPWLEHIRGYRDHLIHRLLIDLTSGFHVSAYGDQVSRAVFPVFVPVETPKYVPDTRASRMMSVHAESPPHSVVTESSASITFPDGRVETRDHTVRIDPAEGYRPIQEQMRIELDAHARFANAVLGRIVTEGMTTFAVSAPP